MADTDHRNDYDIRSLPSTISFSSSSSLSVIHLGNVAKQMTFLILAFILVSSCLFCPVSTLLLQDSEGIVVSSPHLDKESSTLLPVSDGIEPVVISTTPEQTDHNHEVTPDGREDITVKVENGAEDGDGGAESSPAPVETPEVPVQGESDLNPALEEVKEEDPSPDLKEEEKNADETLTPVPTEMEAQPDPEPVPVPQTEAPSSSSVQEVPPVNAVPPGEVTYSGPNVGVEGESLTITCNSSLFDAISWSKNEAKLSDANDLSRYLESTAREEGIRVSALTIARLQTTDSGDYKCTSFAATFHRLDVVPKLATDEPVPVLVPETSEPTLWTSFQPGNEVTLWCNQSQSDSKSFPKWFKNGKLVGEDGRLRIYRQKLVITGSSMSDIGSYMCMTEDMKRGHVTELKVPVTVAPFTNGPDVNVLQYDDLVIECNATGYPLPEITWFMNEDQLTSGPFKSMDIDIKANEHGHPQAVIMIKNMSDPSIREKITCRAVNQLTTDQTATDEASLTVTVRNSIQTSSPPGGVILPSNNNKLVLSCNSTSSALDHWELNGVEIREGEQEKLYISIHQKNNSLLINTVKKHLHEGNYTCVFANNEQGIIQVKAKPDVFVEADGQPNGFISVNIVEGEALTLTCKMNSKDLARDLKWQIQPEDMSSLPRDVDPSMVSVNKTFTDLGMESSLTITGASFNHRSYYVCNGSNGLAFNDARIMIRVKDRLAALWPFLGICAEVFILCTCIFIYESRRTKEEDMLDEEPITLGGAKATKRK